MDGQAGLAYWLIVWFAIHGGDPAPRVSKEVGEVMSAALIYESAAGLAQGAAAEEVRAGAKKAISEAVGRLGR